MRVGVNYLSYGNRGAESDNVLNSDFQYFKAHKIGYVDIRLVMAGMYSGDQISSTSVENIKRAIRAANAAGLKVGITFWTQPPHDSSSGNRFYPSWVGSFGNLCKNATIKQRYLEYVDYMVQQILDAGPIAYWQTLNEPYGSYTTAIEALSNDTADVIRKHSNAPISCRFIAGWNPYNGYFRRSMMDKLDFYSFTVYNDPFSDGYNTASRATWADIEAACRAAQAEGKDVCCIEFGRSGSDDERQRKHYEGCLINRLPSMGVDWAMAWAWQSISPTSESYNCSRGVANGRPAFFELEKVASDTPPPPPPPPEPETATITFIIKGEGTVNAPDMPVQVGNYQATAVPAEGWEFVEWQENGSRLAGSNPVWLQMNRDRTITAVFAEVEPPPPPPVTHTVTLSIVGNGSVTQQPDNPIPDGDTVTLTAEPDEGWQLDGWKIGTLETNVNPLMYEVTEDVTIEAKFSEIVIPPPPPAELEEALTRIAMLEAETALMKTDIAAMYTTIISLEERIAELEHIRATLTDMLANINAEIKATLEAL